jgi:hypothetical protein
MRALLVPRDLGVHVVFVADAAGERTTQTSLSRPFTCSGCGGAKRFGSGPSSNGWSVSTTSCSIIAICAPNSSFANMSGCRTASTTKPIVLATASASTIAAIRLARGEGAKGRGGGAEGVVIGGW